jgi:DNA-binding GntR family transcriptional regulator
MTPEAGALATETPLGAATRVANAVRDRVLTGGIPAGARLSQSQLAAEHGVSRIPVRDALQVLAAEGLVELGGTYAVVRGISIAELQELYEMREALEPVATRLAVPNVGLAEVLQMTRLAEQMESCTDARAWIGDNARFHATVYHQAGRPMMVKTVDQLRRLTDRYLHLHLAVIGHVEHLHVEHRAILDAVRRGDANEVADLTLAHLTSSHRFILDYLLANLPASGT